MRPPGFWDRGGLPATLLAPLGAVTAAATARRVARPGWRAPVAVFCCGNVTVGGAGKTVVALDLLARLAARGAAPAALTRGYGGRERGPLRVDPARHDAAAVGDEALLLAARAPTWLGRDRAETARLAVAAGAGALVMDDGLQNPTLVQDCALLVVDGGSGFGNGRLLPAGPLREPIARAAARARAAVLIGEDRAGAAAALPPGLALLRARLVARGEGLAGARVFAFAGLGRPEKFRASLAELGAEVVGWRVFPDHHAYRAAELAALARAAGDRGARLVSTAKDAVRLPPGLRERVTVVTVALAWEAPEALDALIDAVREERAVLGGR